mmetsp:Transcript_79234/g.164454  ORF Transcript_79234/g.164454 Transcript_79234/m.164454 type:complete len:418 (+) Transcript_79234:102-1355(+)|eukprot:CAMPEP_0206503128 /NCGR_PEP_ID=MMETSP0324_2-20121206/54487_1 /ASSEMBLY_ACC=CAM_ASM_000836 /TAXON_ID=2866 /ORGANISM="Crypthecodinium cohnii, Strain Seligo" /LENGTH=417 /DNA_ID=CAMNT_0053991611 /DNA_START=10 /DNA_END=1263 /DNA_ORIENTATION=+
MTKGRYVIPPPTSWPSKHLRFEPQQEDGGPATQAKLQTVTTMTALTTSHVKPTQSTARGGSKTVEEAQPYFAKVLAAGSRKLHLDRMPTRGLLSWAPALALIDIVADTFRQDLVAGAYVVELGCGLALPGLVCAALGANVVATDLPDMMDDLQHNASACGWPQRVWRVVGGRLAGGLLVEVLPDPAATALPANAPSWLRQSMKAESGQQKLGYGSLVEELDLKGNTLTFRKLVGSGPNRGKVQVARFGGGALMRQDEERPVDAGVPGHFRATPLKWSGEEAVKLRDAGDVELVLCSDCVNAPLFGRCWRDLVDTMDVLCGPRTVVLFSVQRRPGDGLDLFLEELRELDFVTQRMVAQTMDEMEICVYSARRPTPSQRFAELLERRSNELQGQAPQYLPSDDEAEDGDPQEDGTTLAE